MINSLMETSDGVEHLTKEGKKGLIGLINGMKESGI